MRVEYQENQENAPRRQSKEEKPLPEKAGKIIRRKSEKLSQMSEEQLAELQEQDLEEKFRKPLRQKLDEQFPSVSKKEKDAYMAKIETELLDAFDKAGKNVWHRIEEARPFWIFGFSQGIAVFATYLKGKQQVSHYIQLSGFRSPDTQRPQERAERVYEEIPEIKNPKESLQEFVDKKMAEISFPEMYGNLARMGQVSPSFPTHTFRDVFDEMQRGVDELNRARGDPERIVEIARNTKSQIVTILERDHFDDEAVVMNYLRDRLPPGSKFTKTTFEFDELLQEADPDGLFKNFSEGFMRILTLLDNIA